MDLHRIELMGPEYVLMLGVWWGAAVVLTVLVMVIRRAVERFHERPPLDRIAHTAIGYRVKR